MNANNKQPIKIHVSQLPKMLRLKPDKEGFIYGSFFCLESNGGAKFMNGEKTLFECSRPFIMAATHLLMEFSVVVLSETVWHPCRLTVFFNL